MIVRYTELTTLQVIRHFVNIHKNQIVKFDDMKNDEQRDMYILAKSYLEFYEKYNRSDRLKKIKNNLRFQKSNNYCFFRGDIFKVPETEIKF